MTESHSSADRTVDILPTTDDAALERLKRFGGVKLLGEMISLFLSTAPVRIDAARTAVEARDANEAEMAMHSLKSSSAQLGALRMQRLCEQGEADSRRGDIDAVAQLVHDLEAEFPNVRRWLESANARENA
jgi:HPt (histidine-containing phosphotransfer) domain-containing protein